MTDLWTAAIWLFIETAITGMFMAIFRHKRFVHEYDTMSQRAIMRTTG